MKVNQIEEKTPEKMKHSGEESKFFNFNSLISSLKMRRPEGTDAIGFLEGQHREVEDFFARIEEAGDRAVKTKNKYAMAICENLTLHAKIEELYFYPRAKQANKDLVLEAAEEHRNIKNMVMRLSKTDAANEAFDALVKTLKELVMHHVKEEENQLLPQCRTIMGDEVMQQIGAKMIAYTESHKQKSTTHRSVRNKPGVARRTKTAVGVKKRAVNRSPAMA